jgi:hypothetical protein
MPIAGKNDSLLIVDRASDPICRVRCNERIVDCA